MGQALYRTYRSKKLSEVVGQEHITDALTRALKKGTISHAYLFTGPRGVGKTSIARILAHEINGLPYDDDSMHLDIIEIDAASNRRIDEIRDLRDKVHIAPTSAKYKVYIIDEVHMLTKEAFNALLKTLEEPPAHVVFILATTEAHKLPETIISRTQRFSFKPIDKSKVIAHLKHIAKQEKITIDDEALDLIAVHGEGSFRDSISLLDQIRNSDDHIKLSHVQQSLGIAPAETIATIVAALQDHDVVAIAQALHDIQEQGFEPAQVARQIATVLRQTIIERSAVSPDHTLQLLTRLIDVPASRDPKSFLEITLLDAALQGTPKTTSEAAVAKDPVVTAPKTTILREPVQPLSGEASPFAKATGDEPGDKTAGEAEEKNEPLVPAADVDDPPTLTGDTLDAATWGAVTGAIRQKYNTLYSILRIARPQFLPGKVHLESDYAFNQKRLNEARNRQIIIDTIKTVSGLTIHIECTVGKSQPEVAIVETAPLPPAGDEKVHTVGATAAPQNAEVSTISNIFGGAELLES